MKQTAPLFLYLFLLSGMVIELSFQTFYKNSLGPHTSPIVWMIGGILVALAGFGFSLLPKRLNPKLHQTNKTRSYLLFVFSFALLAYWSMGFLNELFVAAPIDAKQSDVIPSLQMYVQRFLAGETVYKPLPFEGYSVAPTYLPLLWMPYSFSEILQIDYRWTAYLVFLTAIGLHTIHLIRKGRLIWEWLIKLVIPFIWIHILSISSAIEFQLAVELMPVGLYLFLTLTIFNKRPFFVGMGILMCLLSRYAFTFWLPIYLLIYWSEMGFKKVFRASLFVVIGVLGLYIIPFLSKDWTAFSKGLAYYKHTASTQWERAPWQPPHERPQYLANGLTTAVYFYDYRKYTLEDRLKFNRKVHISLCAMTALFILFGYFLSRKNEDQSGCPIISISWAKTLLGYFLWIFLRSF